MNAETIHKIRALHALYVQLTGQPISLRMDRERTWFDWLAYRQPEFTAEDLRAVVLHLKAGIKDQKRNLGALKFSNLIGQPDYFEEDLALATAHARPRPPVQHKVSYVTPVAQVGRDSVEPRRTERIVPTSGNEDATKPAAAHVEGCLQNLRNAINE